MANKLPDSGPISMLDIYNILNPPMNPKDCDYYFETREDFYARIDEIIFENNNDLSQKTFGFGDDVTDLNSAFSYSQITSTPKMIVARNATNFSGCFFDCTSLTTISERLFDNCPNIDNFSICFFHCYSLTTIPQGLFDKCIKTTNFNSCFANCYDLITVPYNLFNYNILTTDFSECFNYDREITSALPDVWNKAKFPNVTNGTDYAYNCTNAANYDQIPSNFGGPSTNPPVSLAENTINNTKSLVNSITRTANIPTSPISLNDKDFRELAGISNGQISLRDFYGKSAEKPLPTIPQECDYYFETLEEAKNAIPSILQKYNNDLSNITIGFSDNVNSLYDLFNSTQIIKTPKLLFGNNIYSVRNLFAFCESLTTVSETIFSKLKNATDFREIFYQNYNLKFIPEKLFYYNTNLELMMSCFYDSGLEKLPENLFKNCPNLTDLNECFCFTTLTYIPEGFFDNCTKIDDVYRCFIANLKSVPFTLFDNCSKNLRSVDGCFYDNTEITSALPDVWNKTKFPKVNSYLAYAYGCGNAANYNEMPQECKEPY